MPFDRLLGTVIVERVIDVLSLAACMLGTALLERERFVDFSTTTFSDRSARSCRGFSVIRSCGRRLSPSRSSSSGGSDGPVPPAPRRQDSCNVSPECYRAFSKDSVPYASWIVRGHFSSYGADLGDVLPDVVHLFLRATRNRSASPAAGLFVLVVGGMGMSAPVQGGIGAYHPLVSRGLMLYGLTQTHGLAFATLMHTSQTLVVLIPGSICFGILVFMQRKQVDGNA